MNNSMQLPTKGFLCSGSTPDYNYEANIKDGVVSVNMWIDREEHVFTTTEINTVGKIVQDYYTKHFHSELKEAFSSLMGMNGDRYIKEIKETNRLSLASYEAICDNVRFNSKESVIRYFGLVHYYFLQNQL